MFLQIGKNQYINIDHIISLSVEESKYSFQKDYIIDILTIGNDDITIECDNEDEAVAAYPSSTIAVRVKISHQYYTGGSGGVMASQSVDADKISVVVFG